MMRIPGLQVNTGKYRDIDIEYHVGHFIVQIEDGSIDERAGETILADAMKGIDYEIVGRDGNRWLHVRVNRDVDLLQLVTDLNDKQDEPLFFAEPDLVFRAATTVNDPYLEEADPDDQPYQWGIESINLTKAWNIQTGNDSVVIGLVDTGVPLNVADPDDMELHQKLCGCIDHEDFDGCRFIAGRNYTDISTDPTDPKHRPWPHDESGHGTTMAGIIAATPNNGLGIAGVNWGSPVYCCTIADSSDIATSGTILSAIREVIDFARPESGPRRNVVINLSFTFVPRDSDNWMKMKNLFRCMDMMFGAIVRADAIICIAGGNNYDTVASPDVHLEWPAAWGLDNTRYRPHVVAVGSIDIDRSISEKSARGYKEMVFAPGYHIGTTHREGEYSIESGTSIANAHVSALVALMWSEAPRCSAKEIVSRLWHSSAPESDPHHRIVDAAAALRSVCASATLLTPEIHLSSTPSDGECRGLIEIEFHDVCSVTLLVAVSDHSFGVAPGRHPLDGATNPVFELEVVHAADDDDEVTGEVTIECLEHPRLRWAIPVSAVRA